MTPSVSRTLLLSMSALMLALSAPAPPAHANLFHDRVETVYVPSSSSVLLESSSYVIPARYSYVSARSYVVPTTRYLSTSYVPTTYVLSSTAYIRPTTYYAPARYVVRPARRSVLATSAVLDTAYVLPTTTTLDLPVIRTGSTLVDCCDPTPDICDTVVSAPSTETIISEDPVYTPVAPEVEVESSVAPPSTTSPNGSSESSAPPSKSETVTEPTLDPEVMTPDVMRSTPTAPSTTRSTDTPPARENSPPPQSPTPSTSEAQPAAPAAPSPSPAAAPAPDLGIPPLDIEAPAPIQPAPESPGPAAPNPPVAPPADELPQGANAFEQQRQAMRPALHRPLGEARSTLQGKVVSAVTGDPQAGITVALSDRAGRFVDRTATTRDDGTFSVVLPEGDWAVMLPDSDDKEATSIDRNITVSGGIITDDQNREVTLLTINR